MNAGDSITASISRGSSGIWTISITDTILAWFSVTTHSYRGQLTSAEWIEEAPSVGGGIATLADYGTAVFDPGTANGGPPGLTASNSGVMIQNGAQVSTPSTPDSDVDGFTVAYGASAPSPPGS